ncbi:uncharacterized protein LOC111638581 [Centruroides sculpturatus]|uniref:uncharacterized protein LOC111638581 n=1 Tax=Centruroides sculpturatus TaxID=218467 RepID=UPI000C6D34D1|nr:uncharacterized protein LOC111638581 [Centruroides sculpturatus]
MHSPKTIRANMKTPKMVKSFLESNNLKLLVADKDKCFVLCRNKDFLNRANEFLEHSRSIVLKQDPTSTVLRKVHKVIALPGIVESLAGPLNPPSNVACPRLFFEAKTHKLSWPLRPLVNKRSHPTYHLEAALAKHITSLIPHSELVTTSSTEAKCTILQKLGNLPCNSYRFYKIDVISLYPSVPYFEAIMLANILFLNSSYPASRVLHLHEALSLITQNNYFQFNGKIYKQTQGIPMGSPLSPILAELVMRNIEHQVFNAPLTIQYPLMYLRYVDDVLIAWDSSNEDLLQFTQILASIYPTINFTVEEQENNRISFLDLDISTSPELIFSN